MNANADKAHTSGPGELKTRPLNIAERIYQQLKTDIFDFQLLPGDRFSESEIATRMNASRTPVREALYRLERDGYVQVHFRSGWQVRPFDFRYFEDLYDVRTLLEAAAVRRLCQLPDRADLLAELVTIWCCEEGARLQDGPTVAELDEQFHFVLVTLAGNQQMTDIHLDVCERLSIIWRLDFTRDDRIGATYSEHEQILQRIIEGESKATELELTAHIELSRNTVRTITEDRISLAKIRHGRQKQRS